MASGDRGSGCAGWPPLPAACRLALAGAGTAAVLPAVGLCWLQAAVLPALRALMGSSGCILGPTELVACLLLAGSAGLPAVGSYTPGACCCVLRAGAPCKASQLAWRAESAGLGRAEMLGA